MKTFLIAIFSIYILALAQAQTPLNEAVDFTIKDVNGVQHHLFDILDNQEKYVFIDFFGVN